MKAYELQATGSLDGLRLVDRPEPKPAHGQIVVKVRAASLNYRDLIVMLGAYGKVSLPFFRSPKRPKNHRLNHT